ncbi:MAG: hypothetical protein ACI9DQ_000386, partial [Glaciecola sp.]
QAFLPLDEDSYFSFFDKFSDPNMLPLFTKKTYIRRY